MGIYIGNVGGMGAVGDSCWNYWITLSVAAPCWQNTKYITYQTWGLKTRFSQGCFICKIFSRGFRIHRSDHYFITSRYFLYHIGACCRNLMSHFLSSTYWNHQPQGLADHRKFLYGLCTACRSIHVSFTLLRFHLFFFNMCFWHDKHLVNFKIWWM